MTDIKTIREHLCTAQHYNEHGMRLVTVHQALVDLCDVLRPLGPDGKHDDRHTPLCGCDVDALNETWWNEHFTTPDDLVAETSRGCLVCVDCRVDDGCMGGVRKSAHGGDVTVSAHAVDVGVLSAVVRAALVNAGIVSGDRTGVDVERVVEGDLSYVTRAVAGSVAAHLELHARRPVPAVATRRVDEHADRASAWCDYRNDFGVTDIDTAHKAFLAGWDAAHGRTDESVLR
jgi:hypothetical protein